MTERYHTGGYGPSDRYHTSPKLSPADERALEADERALEAHYAELEAEDEARRKAGGLTVCPECGQRSVRERSFPTRQYGGGYDTTYQCENPLCDYAEVCV